MTDHTCTAEEAYDLPALGVTWVVVCASCGELQGSRSYDLSDARGIGRRHAAWHATHDTAPARRSVADLVTALEESLARAAPTKEPF